VGGRILDENFRVSPVLSSTRRSDTRSAPARPLVGTKRPQASPFRVRGRVPPHPSSPRASGRRRPPVGRKGGATHRPGSAGRSRLRSTVRLPGGLPRGRSDRRSLRAGYHRRLFSSSTGSSTGRGRRAHGRVAGRQVRIVPLVQFGYGSTVPTRLGPDALGSGRRAEALIVSIEA